MKVFGYTQEKDPVAVDLSIDEIVKAGIDPWRLDLFDPAPVVIERLDLSEPVPLIVPRYGRKIYFRALRDLSFVYFEGDTVFIGLHDGREAVCLCVKNSLDLEDPAQFVCFAGMGLAPGDGRLRFSNLEISNRPFTEHFAQYLRGLEKTRTYEGSVAHIVSDANKGIQLRRALSGSGCFSHQPKPARNLLWQGNEAVFDPSDLRIDMMQPLTYVGEMLSELEVQPAFPDSIAWVLEHFGELRPMVVGDALMRLLRREHIADVHVFVGEDDLQRVEQIAGRISGITGLEWRQLRRNYHGIKGVRVDPGVAFKLNNDCQFTFTMRQHPKETVQERFLLDNMYSVDCFYCERPSVIHGNRIAFYDLVRNQARPVGVGDPQEERAQQLKAARFRLIEPSDILKFDLTEWLGPAMSES